MKFCKHCSQEKPFEFFYKSKTNIYSVLCKDCSSKRSKEYYKKNADKLRSKANEYNTQNAEQISLRRKQKYLESPDAARQRAKDWNEKNPGKVLERVKRWGAANPERVLQKAKDWYQKNKERAKQTRKVYYEANKPKFAALSVKRQNAKAQRTPAWLTSFDFVKIECLYQLAAMRTRESGFAWHVDHVIPLRGKLVSGLHVPDNLKVIPASENRVKKNKFTPA